MFDDSFEYWGSFVGGKTMGLFSPGLKLMMGCSVCRAHRAGYIRPMVHYPCLAWR